MSEAVDLKANGKVELGDELTDDEKRWLAALLSQQQVCALLTTPADKSFAAVIQTKLERAES